MYLVHNFAKNVQLKTQCELSVLLCDVRGTFYEPAIKVQNGELFFVILLSKSKSANRSKIYIFETSNI